MKSLKKIPGSVTLDSLAKKTGKNVVTVRRWLVDNNATQFLVRTYIKEKGVHRNVSATTKKWGDRFVTEYGGGAKS